MCRLPSQLQLAAGEQGGIENCDHMDFKRFYMVAILLLLGSNFAINLFLAYATLNFVVAWFLKILNFLRSSEKL
jgi:hypothetical protein